MEELLGKKELEANDLGDSQPVPVVNKNEVLCSEEGTEGVADLLMGE